MVRAILILFLGVLRAWAEPDDAIGPSKPIEHYRALFEAAGAPDPARHKGLEGLVFHCEVATFQPILFDRENDLFVSYGRLKKEYLYPGISLQVKAVGGESFEYQYTGGDLRHISQYRDADSSFFRKDKFGQFVNVKKSNLYPYEKGAMMFFVEVRVSAENELLFESSYVNTGYPLPRDSKAPVSPGGRFLSKEMYVDDYVICRNPAAKAGKPPPRPHTKEDVFHEYFDYLKKNKKWE